MERRNARNGEALAGGFVLMPTVLGALLAFAIAGCGGGSESATGGAGLHITRDFGQRVLKPAVTTELGSGSTAMRQLQRAANVETAFGGRYVSGIDGLRQDSAAGYDWLFYVDGEEPAIGAASWRLKPGQVVQWDRHQWSTVASGGAIVGAFPRPLSTRGVRLTCTAGAAAACAATRDSLTAADVRESAAKTAVQVLVGPWSEVARLPGAPELGDDPARNGAFSAIGHDRLDVVDETGRISRTLPRGSGLIVALRAGTDLRWIVTGVDATGAARAARALTKSTLAEKFAIAVPADGRPFALPVTDTEPGG